ncbi:MAG: Xaa-Pro peptidase family protein [Solobacterium sp.]|nr:Xaa-Pro peptidase family protein [Solobacterium sp.]
MLKRERMNRILDRSEADVLLISDPYAIWYLCEKRLFPGERFLGLLIGKDREPVLFLNELFRFEEEIGIQKQYITDTDTADRLLKDAIGHTGILGVDKTLPARFLLPVMEAGIADRYINGSPAVDHTRAVKDAEETALMRRSSQINDMAMERFKKLVRPQVTEKEVAAQIMDIYLELGAHDFSFPPIVAFGVNAADPHHMPDDTVLKEGDTVLFDVGCKYSNYCSDMTRTFFYKKEPSAEQKRVYDLVRRANEEAEAAVRPGVRLCDIDSIARDIITEGGFGKDFTHRLGHFIGLEDHEYGDVSQSFEDRTEAGNIFSIEPGIYNKEILGCRIEDLVLVTEDGCEVLNQYPHEIEIIE